MNDALTIAAVVDFALHLMSLPEPLVIGGKYPRRKVVEEFEKWAAARKLDTNVIDTKAWQDYWNSK